MLSEMEEAKNRWIDLPHPSPLPPCICYLPFEHYLPLLPSLWQILCLSFSHYFTLELLLTPFIVSHFPFSFFLIYLITTEMTSQLPLSLPYTQRSGPKRYLLQSLGKSIRRTLSSSLLWNSFYFIHHLFWIPSFTEEKIWQHHKVIRI